MPTSYDVDDFGGAKEDDDHDDDHDDYYEERERGSRAVSDLSYGSEGRGIDPSLCCLTLDVVFLVSVFVSQ